MTAPALALRCLALDAAAVAAADLLRRAGTDSVLIKGAGLARRLRADRVYGDVDLLVAPAAFDAAQAALAAAGYRPRIAEERAAEWGHWHERTWAVPGPLALTVDLHRGFAGVGDAHELWRAVRAGAEPMPLAGGTVLVPDVAGCALLAALHAASPGGFTKPADDLARALAVLPADAWADAAGLAARCTAVPAFAVGLRQVPAGRGLAARLGLPEQCPPARWLTAHRATPAAVAVARLAELSDPHQRLRGLARLLLPCPTYLRQTDPRAGGGPGALALAFVRRYLRNARALPRALRDLHAARRQHRA
ncbi:Uncharacterised nucleotidyltransferase [Micromonospora haikouensis]|uniref:Uncharacterized nucleotidyltransferase n=1 Tax=Micromonospora haikouensis TaxID=686309 RepID=A0A1C4YFU9_9ACTN|nr:nucleotidyltransferase family protein [Micromonospora haikouensis]SCF19578.1 Uncharacterised nucleotidyltransferase [Micromonospora haikouensis]